MKSENKLIGFAGMTHLGLCSAVAAAEKGYCVVGWHDDADLIEQIGSGKLPVCEPGLLQAFIDRRDQLSFTADVEALADCDIVYIAFDVPTDDEGRSELGPIRAILEKVAPNVRSDAILVILCQVSPGFTRGFVGLHPNLYYQVETLIFGRALERATQPERIIIGCADLAQPLPPSYISYLECFSCPIMPMHFESAELCKIAINCFLVASVSTTNTLAELCQSIDADWSEIAPALRLDKRIGPYAYLTPGLGISGGNLERDLASVVRMAQLNGADAGLIEEYRRYSSVAKDWPLRMLEQAFPEGFRGRRIAILGLAYKEDTHSTKNSPALKLIRSLDGASLTVYDPVVVLDETPHIVRASTALEAISGAEAVCLMTPWVEFRELEPSAVARIMLGRLVVDPYGLWNLKTVKEAGLQHLVIGRRLPSNTREL